MCSRKRLPRRGTFAQFLRPQKPGAASPRPSGSKMKSVVVSVPSVSLWFESFRDQPYLQEPPMPALILIDLTFGDAGKGTLVDYLTRTENAHTIIRFNGGA